MGLPDLGKFNKIKDVLVSNRDRIIVLLLIAVLVLFIVKILNIVNVDYRTLIKNYTSGKGRGDTITKTDPGYGVIAEDILKGRSMEDYVALIQNDIFKSPDVRLEKKRIVQDSYDKGQKAFEDNKYALAIKHFERVISEDPQRALVAYPIDPMEFLQKAKIAGERKNILDLKKEADDAYRDAGEMDVTTNEGKQESRNLYQKAIQNYQKVIELDPNKELVEKSVLDNATEKMNEAQEKLKQLTEETFRDEIQNLYQQGLDYWNERENNPLNITKARFEWQTALDKISETDPTYEIVGTDMPDRIQKALDNVQIEITAKIPNYYSRGMESFTQGAAENDLVKLEESKNIFEITYEFDPNYKDIKDKLNEVRKAYSKLKEETEVQRAGTILEELKNLLQQAEQAISNNDIDSLQDLKKQSVTLIREIQDLETNKVSSQKSEASKIAGSIDRLKPKPPIEGIELKKIIPFGGSTMVRVWKVDEKKEYTLSTSETRRNVLGIRILEVGEDYIIIEDVKKEKRPTKIFISN